MTDPGRLGDGFDAVVVGAGPNGLSAAIELAEAGKRVLVIEGAATIGGGSRTLELTLPGFLHDPCSAIHPLGLASPFFRTLPLASYGLTWAEPPIALAHPFDDGSAATLSISIDETADSLGGDGPAYKQLMVPLVRDGDVLVRQILGPLRVPRHPIALARFGLKALQSAEHLALSQFVEPRAQAFFTGMAAHSIVELNKISTAAYGLVLALLGHMVGWPIPVGGSQEIVNSLAHHFRTLGGTIQTDVSVRSLDQLSDEAVVLFDVTPKQFLEIAGESVPSRYRKQLGRYRYGPGVFKIDWALDGPVPWTAEQCRRAGTVHLGGNVQEIMASESEVHHGRASDRPLVLIAQQSLFDRTRAPEGKHTLWAYCHVPHGSDIDMTEAIEAQIERFAPGFKDLVLARSTMGPGAIENYNPNYIGGDINGGIQDIRQLFTRPVPRLDPYSTPNRRLFSCSSSTPPGGGVHGMCGYYGARSALRRGW